MRRRFLALPLAAAGLIGAFLRIKVIAAGTECGTDTQSVRRVRGANDQAGSIFPQDVRISGPDLIHTAGPWGCWGRSGIRGQRRGGSQYRTGWSRDFITVLAPPAK